MHVNIIGVSCYREWLQKITHSKVLEYCESKGTMKKAQILSQSENLTILENVEILTLKAQFMDFFRET